MIRQPDIPLPKEQRIQRAFCLYQGIVLILLLKQQEWHAQLEEVTHLNHYDNNRIQEFSGYYQSQHGGKLENTSYMVERLLSIPTRREIGKYFIYG
jgi:hypothetical protein